MTKTLTNNTLNDLTEDELYAPGATFWVEEYSMKSKLMTKDELKERIISKLNKNAQVQRLYRRLMGFKRFAKEVCESNPHAIGLANYKLTGSITFMRELIEIDPVCAGYATGEIVRQAHFEQHLSFMNEKQFKEKKDKVYTWLKSTGERKALRSLCAKMSSSTMTATQPITFKI